MKGSNSTVWNVARCVPHKAFKSNEGGRRERGEREEREREREREETGYEPLEREREREVDLAIYTSKIRRALGVGLL